MSIVNKKALNSALKSVIERLEKTEKFAIDQAPDICKQMIVEKKFDLKLDFSIYFTGSLIGIIGTIICSFQLYFHPADAEMNYCLPRVLVGIGALVLGLVQTDLLMGTIKYIYYMKNCPKLFLLREFANLIGD